MLHQQFNILYTSKNCLYIIKNKLACFFCFLGSYFVFLTLVFHKYVEPNTCFIREIHSDVRDSDVAYGLAFPVQHRSADLCVCVCVCIVSALYSR